MADDREFRLNIGVPNGIILTAIGILELMTPLFIEFDRADLAINLIAGAMLTIGGSASFVLGYKAMKSNSG